MNKLDWTKPIQTRAGLEAVFVCDGLSGINSHAVKINGDCGWYIALRRADGRAYEGFESCADIINVPPHLVKKSGWVVFEKSGRVVWDMIYDTKEKAQEHGANYNVIIAEIHWEEPAA